MRALLIAGAVCGFTGVALGAFGAHALRDRLSQANLEIYRTGVQYHLVHALAILVVALLSDRVRCQPAGWLFTAGIVLFSGSLYALAVTGVRILGAITPLGGLCFLGGWLWLAIAATQLPASIMR